VTFTFVLRRDKSVKDPYYHLCLVRKGRWVGCVVGHIWRTSDNRWRGWDLVADDMIDPGPSLREVRARLTRVVRCSIRMAANQFMEEDRCGKGAGNG